MGIQGRLLATSRCFRIAASGLLLPDCWTRFDNDPIASFVLDDSVEGTLRYENGPSWLCVKASLLTDHEREILANAGCALGTFVVLPALAIASNASARSSYGDCGRSRPMRPSLTIGLLEVRWPRPWLERTMPLHARTASSRSEWTPQYPPIDQKGCLSQLRSRPRIRSDQDRCCAQVTTVVGRAALGGQVDVLGRWDVVSLAAARRLGS